MESHLGIVTWRPSLVSNASKWENKIMCCLSAARVHVKFVAQPWWCLLLLSALGTLGQCWTVWSIWFRKRSRWVWIDFLWGTVTCCTVTRIPDKYDSLLWPYSTVMGYNSARDEQATYKMSVFITSCSKYNKVTVCVLCSGNVLLLETRRCFPFTHTTTNIMLLKNLSELLSLIRNPYNSVFPFANIQEVELQFVKGSACSAPPPCKWHVS